MHIRALAFLLFLTQVVLAQQPTPIVPDPKLIPGDTFDVTAQDLCVPGYAKKVRSENRRTRVSGDPLRDLDGAARIHVFGDSRRTKAVTTNSFQDPAGLRPFLNQLQDTPTIQLSQFNCFTILAEGRKKWSTRI